MYCRYCENFDYDQLANELGYRHHPNWQALCSSAAQGCAICALANENASRRPREDSERKWRKMEKTEQVYCKLLDGKIYWNCGDTQRSSVSVCVDEHEDLKGLILARPVFSNVLEPGCTRMMRRWLERCRDDHDTCPNQDIEHELPTRLLDVGDSTSDPFLINSNGRWGVWAALSHCWGRRLPVKTTKGNLKAHCDGKGLELDRLPPTFQDSIRITRELGIQYLWIDALCIVQDDTDDWEKESRCMHHVYNNAAVTIVAEASPDSSVGILRSMEHSRRDKSKLTQTLCHSKLRGLQGRLYFRDHDRKYERGTSRGCLSTRAWTMQEELLSPRILRFDDHQVLWNCSQTTWSEWNPRHSKPEILGFATKLHESLRGFPKQDSDYGMLPSKEQRQELLKFWYMNVVNYYIGRDLTYKTDRLVAIEGIADEIRSRMVAIDYAAGIWYEGGYQDSIDIHKGLAWSVPVGNAKTNTQQYVAPSWSWAQVNISSAPKFGQHNYFYCKELLESLESLTNSVSITSYIFDPSSTSAITTSKPSERLLLQLEGQCLEVCSHVIPSRFLDERVSDPDNDYYYNFDRVSEAQNANFDTIGLEALTDISCTSIGQRKGHRKLLYIQIARWKPPEQELLWSFGYDHGKYILVIIALILEEIGTALEPLYRRVGLAYIPIDPGRVTKKQWPIQCVSII